MSRLYLVLCILGAVLPLSQLAPFLLEHGLDTRLFFAQLFASDISSFFGLDVIVSAFVLIAFVVVEGRRLAFRRIWPYVAGTLLVGVSFGLPLFLLARERLVSRQVAQPAAGADC
jgi:hypothetical protein